MDIAVRATSKACTHTARCGKPPGFRTAIYQLALRFLSRLHRLGNRHAARCAWNTIRQPCDALDDTLVLPCPPNCVAGVASGCEYCGLAQIAHPLVALQGEILAGLP